MSAYSTIKYMALSTGLVAYYKLDGNSNDSVGSNNGTDTGVSYSSSYGKLGQGVSITGTNSSYISTPIGSTPIGSSARTISCWFKTSNTSGNNAFISYGNVSAYGYRFQLMTTSAGVPYISGYGNDLVGSGNYNDGNWHNMIATYDGTTAKLYLDGVLNASGSVSFNTQNTSLYFGKYSGGGDNLNGYLDEVGIWSRALSAGEISQLYNGGAGLQYPFSNTYNQAINAIGSGASNIKRGFSKLLNVSGSGVSIVKKGMSKVLNVLGDGITDIKRGMNKTIGVIGNGIAVILSGNLYTKTINAIGNGIANLSYIKTTLYHQAINTIAGANANLTKIQGKIIVATGQAIASIKTGRVVIINVVGNGIANVSSGLAKAISVVGRAIGKIGIDFWKDKYTEEENDYYKKYDE